MSKEDPTPYIQEAEDMVNRPAVCRVSGEELGLSNGDLIYLTDEFRPVSDQFSERASYVGSVHRAGGFPWNGIHPETGELQALQSAQWWNIVDLKTL